MLSNNTCNQKRFFSTGRVKVSGSALNFLFPILVIEQYVVNNSTYTHKKLWHSGLPINPQTLLFYTKVFNKGLDDQTSNPIILDPRSTTATNFGYIEYVEYLPVYIFVNNLYIWELLQLQINLLFLYIHRCIINMFDNLIEGYSKIKKKT